MKPIIFQVPKVYNEFQETGSIATFRTSYPDETEFWIRRSRTGSKEFEARLEKVERVREGSTRKFMQAHRERPTGFRWTQDWVEKVKEMHGEIPNGWILHLEKTSGVWKK